MRSSSRWTAASGSTKIKSCFLHDWLLNEINTEMHEKTLGISDNNGFEVTLKATRHFFTWVWEMFTQRERQLTERGADRVTLIC